MASAETEEEESHRVYVACGEVTGICHLLIYDIAFRPLQTTSVENLSDILIEQFGSSILRVSYISDWPVVVVQVAMGDDIKKISDFVEGSVSLHGRVLHANDWNKTYATWVPVQLAAPGTVLPLEPLGPLQLLEGQSVPAPMSRDSSCASF